MKRTFSKEYVNPVAITCTHCGAYTTPRITEHKTDDVVIKECNWICPRCNVRFRTGLIR